MDNKELVKAVSFSIPANLANKDVHSFAKVCSDLVKLYAKKNHDYGNSFEKGMDTIGMAYGIGRLYDKMNRIINLTKVEAEIKEESIEDTLQDLACYSIMTIAYLNSKCLK